MHIVHYECNNNNHIHILYEIKCLHLTAYTMPSFLPNLIHLINIRLKKEETSQIN
jgi:hypothetical protein